MNQNQFENQILENGLFIQSYEKREAFPLKKKNIWSKEEDLKLIDLISKFGTNEWKSVSKSIPGRNGRQCQDRWNDCVNPLLRKGNWSYKEDQQIIEAYRVYGKRWSKIASMLENRSAVDTRNRCKFLETQTASCTSIPIITSASKVSSILSSTSKSIQESYFSQSIQSNNTSTDSEYIPSPRHLLPFNEINVSSFFTNTANRSTFSSSNSHQSDPVSVTQFFYQEKTDTNIQKNCVQVLTQVPGHPYLYYDKDHEVVKHLYKKHEGGEDIMKALFL